MATETPNRIDLFSLMVIRSPDSVDPEVLQQEYILDRWPLLFRGQPQWRDMDFQSAANPSAVGHAVYEAVFCTSVKDSFAKAYPKLVAALLGLLTPYYAPCDEKGPPKKVGNKMPQPLQLSETRLKSSSRI